MARVSEDLSQLIHAGDADHEQQWSCDLETHEFSWHGGPHVSNGGSRGSRRGIEPEDIAGLFKDLGQQVMEVVITGRNAEESRALLMAFADCRDREEPACPREEVTQLVRKLCAEAVGQRLGGECFASGRQSAVVVDGSALELTIQDQVEAEFETDQMVGSACGYLPDQMEAELERALTEGPLPGIDASAHSSGHSELQQPVTSRGWHMSGSDGVMGLGALAGMSVAMSTSYGLSAAVGSISALAIAANRRRRRACNRDESYLSEEHCELTRAKLGKAFVPIDDGLTVEERLDGARAMAMGARFPRLDNGMVIVPLGEIGHSAPSPNPLLTAIELASMAAVVETVQGGGSISKRRLKSITIRGSRGCALTFEHDIPPCSVM